MRALEEEIARAMAALRSRGTLAPYFIGQQLGDQQVAGVSASNGALTASAGTRFRILTTEVRVGSHDLDSTHPIDGMREGETFATAPLDPEAGTALARIAWQEINQEYLRASERFLFVKSQGNLRLGMDDRSGDFSREKSVQYVGTPAPPLEPMQADWEDRVRTLSARLRDKPGVDAADASLEGEATTRWMVNSEGTKIQTGERLYRLTISGSARASDGMDLSRSEDFTASSLAGLPAMDSLLSTVDRIGKELSELRSARVAEPFVGPAILVGRAAGVFFHETFGHRVEGERQKLEEEGQTFAKKLGERVMPAFLSVYDDPTLSKLGGIELSGFYRFDDDGVPAQRASLVESGVLKGFLMSRVPVRGFARSNGHGRRTSGPTMARQANLVVQPNQAVSSAELRRMLVLEAKRQKKTYGLVFADIEGGFTETDRVSTQGYKLIPVLVYRVYVDGRPDELIRGVDIVGTPLISLTKVLAADDEFTVFNGTCGAESGWVPVSVTSPSLLLQQIEVALQDKNDETPPILPAPTAMSGTEP
jgi:predicted Zn-dependent protease